MTADLRFALLGPVRAWRGQTELELGAPQQRSVLAALLLAEGRQVPIGALIDGLWRRTRPGRRGASHARTYVSRLRRVLGRATGAGLAGGLPDGLIESAGDSGYRLAQNGFGLDLDTFVLLTGKARGEPRRPGSGGTAACGRRWPCGRARRWPACRARLAESQRDRLAELRMTALEERLALDIELGGHGAAAAELPELLAGDPLRERLTELLDAGPVPVGPGRPTRWPRSASRSGGSPATWASTRGPACGPCTRASCAWTWAWPPLPRPPRSPRWPT